MFEIDRDERRAVMRLRLSGFWDAATTARFIEELRTHTAAMIAAHGRFDVLSDAREFAVQTPEVAERFSALAEQSSARRTAIVVSSALASMQARRSMASDRVRIFGDITAAQQWLDET